MKKSIFSKADILIPHGVPFENWSVIACDQFSSELEYWERVRERVGDDPSTLNMIIPEAYLNDISIDTEVKRISDEMSRYIEQEIFQKIEDSFIFVERTLSDGLIRRGLVGVIDLEEYSFTGETASILASEGTVLDRLPARISVRSVADLELPHAIAFINDLDMSVIEPLIGLEKELPVLYDFDLMEDGGHIKGMRVNGNHANDILTALAELEAKCDPLIIIGDGNHSLAAAKVYWDEIKQGLSTEERMNHPASKALLEINNVYDPAIIIEAIHRVVFDVDVDEFVRLLSNSLPVGND
jgi:uncharacterized protein (DUF1015 family)